MEGEKKYFEGLNADDDPHLLGERDFINAENIRIGTTNDGTAGFVENIKGNVQLPYAIIASGTFTVIGMCADTEKDRIVRFINVDPPIDTAGFDQIELYDQRTDTAYNLLFANDVQGGLNNTPTTGGLNFHRNVLIHSCAIVGDLLYWTDGVNEPKILNIERAIKTYQPSYVSPDGTIPEPYTLPLKQEDITVLRRPPIYPPQAVKNYNDQFPNNFIRHEAFQFAFRYVYKDYETSVVGAWSILMNFNRESDDFNYITITNNVRERIPNTVQKVELVARVLQSDLVFVIKSWDRDVPSEATEIANNNIGLMLKFDFYNNRIGVGVALSDAAKIEDYVPRTAGTMEVAKNRLFFGDLKVGFNIPKKVRMNLVVGGSELTGNIEGTRYAAFAKFVVGNDELYYAAYWVYITTGAPAGYYVITVTRNTDPFSPVSPLPPPSPVNFSDLIFLGDTRDDAFAFEANFYGYPFYTDDVLSFPTAVTILSNNNYFRAFKTNSHYQAAIAFYDELGRKMGMYTDASMIVNVEQRTYSVTTVKTSIQWTLTNDTNTVNEIPVEAFSYSILLTKNLRTRFFVQSLDDKPKYIKKNDDGTFSSPQNNPSGASNIVLSIQSLNKDGLGYDFKEGDLCVAFHSDGRDPVTLSVVGLYGKYVVVEFHDFGTMSPSDRILFEIYTPYKQSTSEAFYEVGNRYTIRNPTTALRNFVQLTGVLNGDVYSVEKTNVDGVTFEAEVMNINDKFWKRWFTDSSIGILPFDYREKRLPYTIVFSNVYIHGTMNNGLSSFEVLNQEDLPEEMGRLRKLILTSKVQREGNVMLAIAENETASLYLGEAQISDTTGNNFLAKSQGVIGTVNILQGSYGTRNPESVARFRGLVYFFDAYNGKVIQYSVNGLFPISAYKLRRVMKQFSDQYLMMSKAQIEALGSRPFVFGGIDPYHEEYFLALPNVLPEPLKGNLDDYPTSVDATGTITIIDIGDDGDTIEVLVDDPVHGVISLGTYTKQSSDTTPAILAASIASALVGNSYGYGISRVGAVITITARTGLGASINGGSRLSAVVTAFVKIFDNTFDNSFN